MPLYQIVCIKCKQESSHFKREGYMTQDFDCPHCKGTTKVLSVSVSFTSVEVPERHKKR